MGAAIGIDLGTTNTVVAAVVDGVAVTLEDEQKRRLIPSVVSFHPNGTVLVGDAARDRRLIDPENTIYSIKPILGCPFAAEEVKLFQSRYPFQLTEGARQQTMVVARDISYALAEVSAFVLRRAKAVAEHAIGTTVDRAVITVPANFNDLQRAATKVAGRLAGLEVMRILNEPTAAALAYGQAIADTEKIAVFDLGGGTFDVTLLDLAGNVFEVIATAGDTALGGDDVDTALAAYFADEVVRAHKVDPRGSPAAFARLRFAAEDAKKELTRATQTLVELTEIGFDARSMPIRMSLPLTRQRFDEIAGPLVDRTIHVTRQTFDAVDLAPDDFQRVLLVGGSTRMPLVHQRVRELFGKPPHMRVNPDEVVALGAAIQANALSRAKGGAKKKTAAGALGASDQAGTVKGERVASRPPMSDPHVTLPEFPATPNVPDLATGGGISYSRPQATLSFGSLESASASTLPPPPEPDAPAAPAATGARQPPPVPRRDPRLEAPPLPKPARRSRSSRPDPRREAESEEELTAAEPEKSPEEFLAPDAVIAADPPAPPPGPKPPRLPPTARDLEAGHAIEARIDAPLLIDVTPLSLRVETVGGYSDVLIHANAAVPCEQTRAFLTSRDGQTTVTIRVAQGEDPRFAGNAFLGELELTGIASAMRGEAKVAVTFELDADGILNVRAQDTMTGRETSATMRVAGAETDEAALAAMMTRQGRRLVAD